MRLTTVTIPAVEFATREEKNETWMQYQRRNSPWGKPVVIEGKEIEWWNTDDGNDEILFKGETRYHVVTICPKAEAERVARLEKEIEQLKLEKSWRDEVVRLDAERERLRGWEHMGS